MFKVKGARWLKKKAKEKLLSFFTSDYCEKVTILSIDHMVGEC